MYNVRVASVQIEHGDNDKAGNLAKIRGFVGEAEVQRHVVGHRCAAQVANEAEAETRRVGMLHGLG